MEKCAYCAESIEANAEPVILGEQMYHAECIVRATQGSAAHMLKECTCYGGTRDDPPGKTLREAAKLAHETFKILNAKAKE